MLCIDTLMYFFPEIMILYVLLHNTKLHYTHNTKCIPSFSVRNKSHKGMQTDMLTNVYSMQTTLLLKQYSHFLHFPHYKLGKVLQT